MPKPKMDETGGVKRIQMDLPPRSFERLKRLRDVTEAASYAEVMKNALRLYEALIVEVEGGHEILVRRGDTVAPLQIFTA